MWWEVSVRPAAVGACRPDMARGRTDLNLSSAAARLGAPANMSITPPRRANRHFTWASQGMRGEGSGSTTYGWNSLHRHSDSGATRKVDRIKNAVTMRAAAARRRERAPSVAALGDTIRDRRRVTWPADATTASSGRHAADAADGVYAGRRIRDEIELKVAAVDDGALRVNRTGNLVTFVQLAAESI